VAAAEPISWEGTEVKSEKSVTDQLAGTLKRPGKQEAQRGLLQLK
jgi:hypothetical protein